MLYFIKTYLTTLFTSLLIMGVAYFIFWWLFGKKLSNRKIQLSKRAGWAQLKDEIINAAVTILGGTGFTMLILLLNNQGFAKLYNDTGKYGVGYEVLVVLLMIIVSDTWFYWLHRWMHHPRVYKYVHALHHKSLDVNPFTSNSFHVAEAILLTLWILPFIIIFPVSPLALGIVQAAGTFNNLKSHLGYELFPRFFRYPPFNMLVTSTNHNLHHTQYNGNYGLYFRFWDILCGTELNSTNTLFTEIHERSNSQVTDNTRYQTLTIEKLVRETADTVSVYLKTENKAFYNYYAGQQLTIRVQIKGKTYHRCFSLSSSPGADDFLRITVKLKGEVSHWFYYTAQPGDTIQSLLPVGDFMVVASPIAAKRYVMIAGGSGITAIYSIIKQLLVFEPGSSIVLLYANKSADNIIFKNELDHLADTYPNFTCTYFISGKSRISVTDVHNQAGATFYICGPASLNHNMAAILKKTGIPASHINVAHYADGYKPFFGFI